jgi:PAS domain S-box-containing protein
LLRSDSGNSMLPITPGANGGSLDRPDLQMFASRVADAIRDIPDGEQRSLLLQVVEDLRTTVETLQVTNEELRAQGEELQAARDIIERDRHRYRELFEGIPDAYIVTDHVGVIREANPEASALLGLHGQVLWGRPLALHVAPEGRREFRNELVTLRGLRGVRRMTLTLCFREDQERRHVEARVRIVPGEDGEAVLHWTMRDVGAERREADQLRDLDVKFAQPERFGGTTVDAVAELAAWLEETTGAAVMVPGEEGGLAPLGDPDGPGPLLVRLHADTGEGPAYDAYLNREVVEVTNVAVDPAYPRMARATAEVGITGVAAYPLRSHAEPIGVLVVDLERTGRVSEQAVEGVALVVQVVRALLARAQEAASAKTLAAQLQTALDSRVVIEQAKGKLSERLSCTPDDAFHLLRRHARSQNLKLHDLAARIARGDAELD